MVHLQWEYESVIVERRLYKLPYSGLPMGRFFALAQNNKLSEVPSEIQTHMGTMRVCADDVPVARDAHVLLGCKIQ